MGERLFREPLTIDAMLSETTDGECGALAVFAGTVRATNEGERVDSITYTAYEPLAERVLAEIERQVTDDWGARRCRIAHRIGILQVGEASVVVVVRAAHRDEAFRAARRAIDELKRRAPIYKEEHFDAGGSRFVRGVPLQSSESGGAAR